MDLDESTRPSEERRAAIHRERSEAIEGLRAQIEALVAREPELRKEIAELEKYQRTTISELERNERKTIAELDKSHRATIAGLQQALRAKPENAEELEAELERTRTELDEEFERTRSRLAEELATTRTELAERLAGMRAEFASIRPTLIESRCTLGMKMSDFALDENEGHQDAIEFIKPLLAELRSNQTRALAEARHDMSEAEEELKALQAERHQTAEAALPLVERRYQPLIDAEIVGVTIEQAKVRVARHQLALVLNEEHVHAPDDDDDMDEADLRLARELELEAALDELDAARAKVTALQEEKKTAVYHYSHPTAEKSKRLGESLAKRFGRHH